MLLPWFELLSLAGTGSRRREITAGTLLMMRALVLRVLSLRVLLLQVLLLQVPVRRNEVYRFRRVL